jgi:hypothetical protein
MSSTAGIQNLLVNVFRPIYTYDPFTTLFTPKLSISNIDNYSGNTISVFTAAVGDSASNVYVGSNAGNLYTAIRASSNNTALGFGAGSSISNVSNSTYIGFNAGSGASNASSVIAIGASAGGNGISNIFVGNGTGGTGSNNILIGHGISSGSSNYKFQLGSTLYGDLSKNWIGIGRPTPLDITDALDVSGNVYVLGQVGINTIPTHTLDINGDTRSSGGFLSIQSNVLLTGGGPNVTIGPIKKGIIAVSAVDQDTTANRVAKIFFAYSTSNVVALSSSQSGDIDFATSSTNLQLATTATSSNIIADYSITYFPLP